MAGSEFQMRGASLPERMERAVARLRLGPSGWVDAEAVPDFQALVALTGILSASLTTGNVTESTVPDDPMRRSLVRVTVDLAGVGDRADGARALWSPFFAFRALDNGPSEPPSVEVGALPLGLIVAGTLVGVSVVVAQSAVGAYAISQASQLVSNVLARRADSQRLQATQAAALEAAAKHTAAEREAGKTLPLDQATKSLLESLAQQSRDIIATRHEQDAGVMAASPPAPGVARWKIYAAAGAAAVVLGGGLYLFRRERR